MADIDWSSVDHRLENYRVMKFLQAYAQVRYHVFLGEHQGDLAHFLRGYCGELEHAMAVQLGVPEFLFVGLIADLGNELCNPKGAKNADDGFMTQ